MFTNQRAQLNQLLQTSISSLDIADEEYRLAVSRYRAVGDFLSSYWEDSSADGVVYPQGSMRLGTVTRKIHRNDEIDLDLVARREIQRTSITQTELKSDAGHGLDLFVKTEPEGNPSKEEGRRCWTLVYRGFHLDLLPALPDPDNLGTGIIITDKAARNWQFSDPIGYADWFHSVMRREFLEKAAALRASMGIEDVPVWRVKTTLQRTVQALKRHRDIYFTADLANRPASVIITTLAARAYRPDGDLYDTLREVTAAMPDHVEHVGGTLLVRNPVQERENFADRWQTHPRRAERFFEWIQQAQRDFEDIAADRGIDRVLEKVERSFGSRAAEHAARSSGADLLGSRAAGLLNFAGSAATLTPASGRRVRDHHFHGEENDS